MRAQSTGTEAVRLEVIDDPRSLVTPASDALKLTGTWDRVKVGFRSAHPGDSAELKFAGTGICWIGSMDPSGGTADVYIDGKLEGSAISLYARPQASDQLPVDTSHEILFSKQGLPKGSHTIKVVVSKREDASADQFVTMDAFQVLDPRIRGPVRFIVDNLWNYPRLSWGNYVKDPIIVKAGYSNTVRFQFSDRDEP